MTRIIGGDFRGRSIKVPDARPQLGFVSSFLPTYSRSAVDGGISTTRYVAPEAVFAERK